MLRDKKSKWISYRSIFEGHFWVYFITTCPKKEKQKLQMYILQEYFSLLPHYWFRKFYSNGQKSVLSSLMPRTSEFSIKMATDKEKIIQFWTSDDNNDKKFTDMRHNTQVLITCRQSQSKTEKKCIVTNFRYFWKEPSRSMP